MNRKQFLKCLGGAGLVTLIPKSFASAEQPLRKVAAPACFLTSAVPEGPFYFDKNMVRKDITEGREGVAVNYQFTVVDVSCAPVANALVDIWQCDKDGAYSGYAGQPGGINTAGKTFLRGIQTTDAQGQVQFTSIYPGWYPNRLTHLHVKIRLKSQVYVTTNLFYPDAVSKEVYNSALYRTRGQNPAAVANDVELRGDTSRFKNLQTTLTPDGKGGYVGTYTFGIVAAQQAKGI
jgi:protocatechuate 3,4-dioxygenase beta subunit